MPDIILALENLLWHSWTLFGDNGFHRFLIQGWTYDNHRSAATTVLWILEWALRFGVSW